MNSTITNMAQAILLSLLVAGCASDTTPTEAPARDGRRLTVGTAVVTKLVTTAAFTGDGSLTQVLATAVNGDVIGFAPEVTRIVATAIIEPRAIVTLQGPASGVTIERQGPGRIIQFPASAGLTLRNITLTNATGSSCGSAIANFGPLTLDHARLTNNAADVGGAICAVGELTIIASEFTGNSAATGDGGAIKATGPVTIRASRFSGNTGEGHGGAVLVDGSTDVTIENSTFVDNKSTVGGAIHSSRSKIAITGSVFIHNTAGVGAEALFIDAPSGSALVVNSTFVEAGIPTGVLKDQVLISRGTGSLSHVTFVGKFGGSVSGQIASVTVENSLFVGATCAPDNLVFSGNNRADSPTCAVTGVTVGPTAIGALADNGGPTQTIALPFGSPAIDAATNCPVATDQRGVTRPKGLGCDLGAFEFDDLTKATFTVDPSGTVSTRTGVAFVSGTIRCSRGAPVTFSVTGQQAQKVGRVNTTVTGASTVSTPCDGTPRAWSAAMTPATGGFSTANMRVTAAAAATDALEAPAVTNAAVKMSWSKR